MFIKDFVSSELSESKITTLLEISIVSNMIMLESMMGSLGKPKSLDEANKIIEDYIRKLPSQDGLNNITDINNAEILEMFRNSIVRNDFMVDGSEQGGEEYWHNVLESLALYIFDRIVILSNPKLSCFLKFDFFIKNDRWELLVKKDDKDEKIIRLIYCKVNGGAVNINATLGFVNYCYFIAKRNLKKKPKDEILPNLSRELIQSTKHLDLLLTEETTANQVALLAITAIDHAKTITILDTKTEHDAKKSFVTTNYHKSLATLQYSGKDQVLNSISDYLNSSAKALIDDNIERVLKYHSESGKQIWDCAKIIALASIYEHEIRVNPEGDSYLLSIKHHEDEWLFILSKEKDCLKISKVTLNSIDISDIYNEMILSSGIKEHSMNLIEDATKIPVI